MLTLLPFWCAVIIAGPAPTAEPPVVLPTVTVREERELPPRESWRYLTLPGFEVLSDAPAAHTKKLLREFQLYRHALAQVWPIATATARPTQLILCGRRGNFESFVPEVAKGDPNRGAYSLFLHDRTRATIVVDCASKTAGILSDQGRDDIVIEATRELYRQYVFLVMSRLEPAAPPWFVEGFAQIAKAMEFDRQRIVFGQLQEPDLVSASKENSAIRQKVEFAALGARTTDRSIVPPSSAGGFVDPFAEIDFGVENKGFLARLKGKPLLPLEKFFAVRENSIETIAPVGPAAVWPQQAYAFVHFCLFGEHGKYQQPLARLVQRLNREPPSEALFKDCFHVGYAQMSARLQSYQDLACYSYLSYRAKGDGLPPPIEPLDRESTPAETGRIKADALDLGGHHELARAELIAPYLRNEYDGPLLAALGLWEHRSGHSDRARKFLEAAYNSDTVPRPEACIELARYRRAASAAKPGGPDGKFSAAQTAAIIEPLLSAQRQPPPMAVVYELMADTWLRAEDRPAVEQVELLIHGAQLYPARFDLLFDTARLCESVGLKEPAKALAAHGVKYAPEASGKVRFAELLNRVQ